MKQKIFFTWEELEKIVMKEIDGYESEDRNFRRLAYTIHTRFCEVNEYGWRDTLNHLKWVKSKLDKLA